jgi:quercetin dioxygenase-like cupin family protein
MNTTDKIISQPWQPGSVGSGVTISRVLDRGINVEGLDITRIKGQSGGEFPFENKDGHLFSLIHGEGRLYVESEPGPLFLGAGTHVYLPPGCDAKLRMSADTFMVHVSGPKEQARGKKVLLRNEKYLQAYRFTLTPQYLSRRAFVHRDPALVSKNGDPVAWFHTTMFDTNGLPANAEGKPVFKMSYDNQTEPNVVYEVVGRASVRMAEHPYILDQQKWGEWNNLDGDTTYYLNEGIHGKEIEWHKDPVTQENYSLRNRHEVFIENGSHVSLCCLFDPGPTGLETHAPGEYSSYTPVSKTLGTPEYAEYLKKMAPLDDMLDTLSMMEARGQLDAAKRLPQWNLYESTLKAQLEKEAELHRQLQNQGNGRAAIIEPWRITSRI